MTPWSEAEVQARAARHARTLMVLSRRQGEPLTEEEAQKRGLEQALFAEHLRTLRLTILDALPQPSPIEEEEDA